MLLRVKFYATNNSSGEAGAILRSELSAEDFTAFLNWALANFVWFQLRLKALVGLRACLNVCVFMLYNLPACL